MNEQSLPDDFSEEAETPEVNEVVEPLNQLTCVTCGRTYARIDHLERHARTRMVPTFPGSLPLSKL